MMCTYISFFMMCARDEPREAGPPCLLHVRLALQVLHEARLAVAVHVARRAAERLRDPLRNAVDLRERVPAAKTPL